MGSAQTFSFGSQLAEQQSPLDAQLWPFALQFPLTPPVPAVPPPAPAAPDAPAEPSLPASFFVFAFELLPQPLASASASPQAPRIPNHPTRMPHLVMPGESGQAPAIMKGVTSCTCAPYMGPGSGATPIAEMTLELP